MKREEALKLARSALGKHERLADLILSAYRKGEVEMRERCADAAELHRRTAIYGSADATDMAVGIRNAILALPLTDDPQPHHQQIRDGTEGEEKPG